MAGIVQEGLRGRQMPARKQSSVYGDAPTDRGVKNDEERFVYFVSRYKQHRLQLVKTDPMIVNGTTIPASSVFVQFTDYCLKLPKDDARNDLLRKHGSFGVEFWLKKDRDEAVAQQKAQEFLSQFDELPEPVKAILKQKAGKGSFDLKLPHVAAAEKEAVES